MSNVVGLPTLGLKDIPDSLRKIADRIESGEINVKNITLTTGDTVFHLGDINNDVARKNAVFNLQSGLHNLMKAIWR